MEIRLVHAQQGRAVRENEVKLTEIVLGLPCLPAILQIVPQRCPSRVQGILFAPHSVFGGLAHKFTTGAVVRKHGGEWPEHGKNAVHRVRGGIGHACGLAGKLLPQFLLVLLVHESQQRAVEHDNRQHEQQEIG